jgi:hypothetical protein
MVFITMIPYIFSDLQIITDVPPQNKFDQPIELSWDLSEPIIKELTATKQNVDRFRKDVTIDTLSVPSFSDKFQNKKNINVDSLIQMAMQAAFYKLHGYFAHTYEPISMNRYYGGRTETIRSCTAAGCRFIKAYLDLKSARQTKVELLKEAMENHGKLKKDALFGKGIDRHLFGLYMAGIINGIEIHPLFSDKTFSMQWTLSTSPIIADDEKLDVELTGGGFGPVAHDGYGIGYLIKDDKIVFTVTSYRSSEKSDPIRLIKFIEENLNEIADLLN